MMMNIAHTVNKFNITANTDVKIHTNTVDANSYSLFFVVIDNVTTFVDREYATLLMTAQGNLSDVSIWNINRNMEFSQNYASQTFVFFIKNTTRNPIGIDAIVHLFSSTKSSMEMDILQMQMSWPI